MPDVPRRLRLLLLVLLTVAVLAPFPDAPDDGADRGAGTTSPRADAPGPSRTIPERRRVEPAVVPVPAPTDPQTRAVVAAGARFGAIRHGGGRHRFVALTFDDGPGPYTAAVLAVLRRTRAPATFFQVGRNLEEYPYPGQATALLNRVAIGDHTYTHRSLRSLAATEQQDEVLATAAVMEAHGEAVPRLFRPPYGAYDRATQEVVTARGMALVLWSVDSEDYTRPGARRIARKVLDDVTPGAIVLLHDGGGDRGQTVQALPRIIKGLRARGYDLVTVPELLQRDPPRG